MNRNACAAPGRAGLWVVPLVLVAGVMTFVAVAWTAAARADGDAERIGSAQNAGRPGAIGAAKTRDTAAATAAAADQTDSIASDAEDANAPAEPEPIVWYGMMPHPYTVVVKQGVAAAAEDDNVRVLKVMGEEWTQEDENRNVMQLSGRGHKAFCLFPGDPAGANGLAEQLTDAGQLVVWYGAEPRLPTPAPFTVGTDIKGAAEVAAEHLIKLMGEKGNILNVLETVTDINTQQAARPVSRPSSSSTRT